MANQITNAMATKFGVEVVNAFQQFGPKLQSVVTNVHILGNNVYKWPTMGIVGSSASKPRDGEYIPVTIDQGNIVTTLSDYDFAIILDKLDAQKSLINNKEMYVKNTVSGIGRDLDKAIITALDGTTLDAKNVIADAAAGFNHDKMLQIKERFDELEVPDMDRVLVLSSRAVSGIYKEDKFAREDYKTAYGGNSNAISNLMGFKVITHSGLTNPSGNLRDCYAFHKSAVGLAIGQDIQSRIDFVAMRGADVIVSTMSVGADVINKPGVIRIGIDEAA